MWAWAGVGVVLVLALVFGWLVLRPTWQPKSIVAVEGTVDGRTLDVTVVHEDCGSGDPRVHAGETSDGEVVLSAEYRKDRECDDVGVRSTITVKLAREVGDRAIRVARLGRDFDCDIAGRVDQPCIASDSTE